MLKITRIERLLAYIKTLLYFALGGLLICAAPALGQASAPSANGPFITPNVLFQPFPITDFRSPIDKQNGLFPVTSLSAQASLPQHLWFQTSTSVSQGLVTNVLQTAANYKYDYVCPTNMQGTIGYDLIHGLSAVCDYQVIKNVYAENERLNQPTPQTLGFGLKQILYGRKLEQNSQVVNFNFEGQESWSARNSRTFALNPSVQFQQMWTTNKPCKVPLKDSFALTYQYSMPLKWPEPFSGDFQSITPTYSVMAQLQKCQWICKLGTTFVENFPIPEEAPSKRKNFILFQVPMEIAHPLKRPGLIAFLDGAPQWYGDSHHAAGRSGFGFTLTAGLRLQLNKTPVNERALRITADKLAADPSLSRKPKKDMLRLRKKLGYKDPKPLWKSNFLIPSLNGSQQPVMTP